MSRKATRRLWLLVATIVVVDQLSKHWALNRLSGNRTIDVVGSLRFNLAFNKGMAFSQATGAGPIIGALGFVAVSKSSPALVRVVDMKHPSSV